MKHNTYENWVEIDLEAIRGNIRQIRRIAGCPIMAVIKANAYGHGTIPVARAAIEAGSSFFAVARFGEAMEIRKAGITAPILIFGRLGPENAIQAAAENFRVTVFCEQQVVEYTEALRNTKQKLIVHAKIDTGMGRLGSPAESGLTLLQMIQSAPNLETEGLFTHFARSDELNVNTTDQQLDRFEKLINTLTENGLRPKIVHTANSAGAIFHPRACQYDMVRGGIAIYGLNPSVQTPLPAGFRPALSWKAEIISVKAMPAGCGISYGHKYLTKRNGDRIGVIPVGYADGFRRTTGNEVLVGGKRVPVLGNICMDQCMIDLNDVPDARPGGEAVLIGRQGNDEISADEVAGRWGSINYEVTCGVSHRVDRIYL